MVHGRHVASTILRAMESLCEEWKLGGTEDCNVFLTADRGSNVVAAVRDSTMFKHIPCLQHVLHRAILSTLEVRGMSGLFKRLAQVGGHFAKSPTSCSLYKEFLVSKKQKVLLPKTPCKTRWHSFYLAGIRYLDIHEWLEQWTSSSRTDDHNAGCVHRYLLTSS